MENEKMLINLALQEEEMKLTYINKKYEQIKEVLKYKKFIPNFVLSYGKYHLMDRIENTFDDIKSIVEELHNKSVKCYEKHPDKEIFFFINHITKPILNATNKFNEIFYPLYNEICNNRIILGQKEFIILAKLYEIIKEITNDLHILMKKIDSNSDEILKYFHETYGGSVHDVVGGLLLYRHNELLEQLNHIIFSDFQTIENLTDYKLSKNRFIEMIIDCSCIEHFEHMLEIYGDNQ